jgi:hypothetical protein
MDKLLKSPDCTDTVIAGLIVVALESTAEKLRPRAVGIVLRGTPIVAVRETACTAIISITIIHYVFPYSVKLILTWQKPVIVDRSIIFRFMVITNLCGGSCY